MNNPDKWEVWSASVKFEESIERKQRPVVIIKPGTAVCISLKVTSHPPRENCIGEYPLKKWKEAGLYKPSTVRVSKVIELTSNDFAGKIGRLHPIDILALQNILELGYRK